MKKAILCILSLVLASAGVTSAQTTIIKLNTIKDADSVASIQYAYPHFRDGRVVFINQGITPAKLNYSRVNGEILFKNGNNILALNQLEIIKLVTIERDTFFVSPAGGFVKQIDRYPAVALVKTSRLKLAGREVKAAYGGYSKVSVSRPLVTVSGSEQIGERLAVDENLLYTLTTTYYLLTSANKLFEASEKAFLLGYADNKKEIKTFIDSAKINFNKENDLTRLLHFAQSFH